MSDFYSFYDAKQCNENQLSCGACNNHKITLAYWSFINISFGSVFSTVEFMD